MGLSGCEKIPRNETEFEGKHIIIISLFLIKISGEKREANMEKEKLESVRKKKEREREREKGERNGRTIL